MAVTASASEVSVHSHFLCGGNSCTAPTVHQGDVQTEFTQKLTSDNGILKIEGTAAGGNSAYELGAGSYYLDANLTLNKGIYITGDVTLCLNGHDIEIEERKNVIGIRNANKLTLCDCKGTGKLTSQDGRGLDFSGDGSNARTGTFIMYGGSITGNSATATGAGVSVWDNCTFNMYGGAITGNSAQEGGGGVAAHGTFNMYGGAITDNTCNGSYNGGGVYVKNGTWSTGAITLSGNVQIRDNFKGGQLEGGVYVKGTTGSPSNIYLARNKTITADGSLTGSFIGVTTAAEPSTGSNVTFAVGSENTITTGIFTPDTAGVLVGVAADGTSAYLYKCSHVYNEWAYDQEYHWKKCTNVGCDSVEAGSKIAHTWDYPADYNKPKTCVCGATQGEPLTRSYYYYAPSAAEDKKDSPKAGDPGVLLYAGLALTSLTGLAYTAKKRH